MKKFIHFIMCLCLLASCGLIWACSAKKVSNTYGDNQVYKNEDSTGEVKVKEKKIKMPFDTSSLPTRPSIEKTPYPNQ